LVKFDLSVCELHPVVEAVDVELLVLGIEIVLLDH